MQLFHEHGRADFEADVRRVAREEHSAIRSDDARGDRAEERSDLIARVTIGNSSLAANQHVRSVLLKSLDQIKADVEAARAYDDESEDFYAPDDDEPAPPPSTWLKPRS